MATGWCGGDASDVDNFNDETFATVAQRPTGELTSGVALEPFRNKLKAGKRRADRRDVGGLFCKWFGWEDGSVAL